jgi:hypothetical protein
MSERLEQDLRALELAWPATPDLAGAVLARLEAEPVAAPRRRSWWPSRGLVPAVAWTAAAVVAALAITMAASPSARSAILEWLGLKSVKIERKAPTATPVPRRSQLGSELNLGQQVSLEEARRLVGFRVRVPSALSAPDAVWYHGPPPPGGRVSFVYRPQPGLTRSPQTGAGLLVSEWRAIVGPVIEKAAGNARVERLMVDGDRAYFISGAPHGMVWQDANGRIDYEDQRLAGNTLLVERSDGLLLRVEGQLSRDAAVRIARSVR